MSDVIIRHVGGGSSDVVAKIIVSTTQPASAKEGAIWVNSSTPLNGYAFSATQPTSPVEGMVWIETSTTHALEFEALKENSIIVHPARCWQYVSGAWASKEGQIYLDSVWAPLRTYVFNEGVINTQLVGGINGDIQPDHIYFYIAAINTDQGNKTYTTAKPIDLTNYKSIKMRFMGTATTAGKYFRATVMNKSYDGTNAAASACVAYKHTASPFNSEERLLTLDISALSGEYYPGYTWGALSSANGHTVKGYIYEWWLE